MNYRSSGILLHPTCLPTGFGIGDLGPQAYRFADFLAAAKQSFWQILPLNPTDPDHYNSPYHSTSAFAGNPLLISPELLVEAGWLTESDLMPAPDFPAARVDFAAVGAYKEGLLTRAYERFSGQGAKEKFEHFCRRNQSWLDDYVLFEALKVHYGGRPWYQWPEEIRRRSPQALEAVQHTLRDRIRQLKFRQYVLFRQWRALKDYCHQKQIHVIGDIPIYMPYDSADLWTHPDLFKLDEDQKPYVVSGVPPDYFSATGQLWGHPVYRWETLQQNGYDWWIRRIQWNLELFDVVRIDHFRGLVAYWEVPADEKTAINGKWVSVPVEDFLHQLLRRFPCLPIIAEDLGIITPDVREIMHRYQLPGMRLLLFAFGEDFPKSSFLPHHHVQNCLIYTGTHDNHTVQGWFAQEATPETQERLHRYFGRRIPVHELHWEMIRLAMMSVAKTAIIPLQDILGLGAEARMNNPARPDGNWQWRLSEDPLKPELSARLLEMTEIYGRA
ncbi:MAG: 4-alpha-glucanotransferase [Desulfobacterales bacterium]|nr:MAG: 4-alpha-glucanotransferase [Desulfobacterales bacterium]